MQSLSMPPAWQGPLPEATPPSDMAVYQLPTGSYETRASFAFKGGSFRDKRSFAATILVTHPEGDFLVPRFCMDWKKRVGKISEFNQSFQVFRALGERY